MYAGGGGAVAAMRGKIIRAFARVGAFNETEAKSLDELGLRLYARGMFSRMEQRGIIIKTNDDRYYLDKEYYDSRMRRLNIVRPVVFIILAAVIVCLIIFTRLI